MSSNIRCELEEVALTGIKNANGTNRKWLSTCGPKLTIYHYHLMDRNFRKVVP